MLYEVITGVVGNGASAEVLEQAGIKSCDIFIAVTDLDEVNILSCLLTGLSGKIPAVCPSLPMPKTPAT